MVIVTLWLESLSPSAVLRNVFQNKPTIWSHRRYTTESSTDETNQAEAVGRSTFLV